MTTRRKPVPTPPPRPPVVDNIADHPDYCPCPRCVGLTLCYCCGRVKLDADWCWFTRRLVP